MLRPTATTRTLCAWAALLAASLACATPLGAQGLASAVRLSSTGAAGSGPPAQTGSVSADPGQPFAGTLSLSDAVQRGLRYNLSAVGLVHAERQARAQAALARSVLLPNVVARIADNVQKLNLAAAGVRFDIPIPGFTLPDSVGPFNVFDARARVSQSLFDPSARNSYRAAQESVRSVELTARDTRDAIVLAVGSAYLQTVAARERLRTATTQIETASALLQRTTQQRAAGLATPIDVNRAQVQVLAQQHRLTSLQAQFAKQKISLARMIGLPPTDRYDLDTDVPYAAGASLDVDAAVEHAVTQRADVSAAEAQVRAAELALAAAQGIRLPTASLDADIGVNHSSPTPVQSTYSVTASVRIPIWEGGRAKAEVERAAAALSQRRAELEDTRAEVQGEVRRAFLDLQAAASQVEVARKNTDVTRENLTLTRQRFDAGVSDNLAVVQAQDSLATAELDYVNGVFAHNLSKLELARALGRAADGLAEFLKLP